MGGEGESAKLSSTEDNTDQLAFTLGVFREDQGAVNQNLGYWGKQSTKIPDCTSGQPERVLGLKGNGDQSEKET